MSGKGQGRGLTIKRDGHAPGADPTFGLGYVAADEVGIFHDAANVQKLIAGAVLSPGTPCG